MQGRGGDTAGSAPMNESRRSSWRRGLGISHATGKGLVGEGWAAQAGCSEDSQRFLGSRKAGALTGQPPRQEGRGQVGVDTGSLRFVSRKAERVHIRLQQLFCFLLSLGLCPVPDSNHQKPLASPPTSPMAHVRAPAHAHSPTDPHVHLQTACTQAHTLTHAQRPAGTLRHGCTWICTCRHTHIHTQTHTHRCTPAMLCS